MVMVMTTTIVTTMAEMISMSPYVTVTAGRL